MEISEYQEFVKRTCAVTNREEVLKLALIGLQGELGEVAEPIKKHLWGGHHLDCTHLREEIGDVCWYLATLCNSLDISLDEALQANIEKLSRRYPDGFSAERSQHRQV
ncbi:MAG TPA: nucleoside triphosphate pyrophosphohydrolase family protein [Ktedonobacteraceae bacterium]|nr:nucleoside triphosphate pyrophosphohydrolase family protein [Ktedonobacteraceae bacterium]